LLSANVKAESVFSLDLKTDILLSTLAMGVFASSLFIETPPSHIPYSLNRSDVNPFDRSFMFTSYNRTIRYISTTTMVSMAAFLPASAVLYDFNMNRLITYGVMYTQATFLAYGIRILLRNNITRFRPYDHDGKVLGSNSRHDSFPSGHTTVAFMSATFFATTFSMDNPDSRWKWPAIVGSYALAACVGAMRITSGMHFFTDVLAGAAIGSLFGWVVPYLHRGQSNINNFPITITKNGLLASFAF